MDKAGACSGYIIWVSGKGIMVDPPPFSSVALRTYGIPSNLIEKVIITHCHADHDAGTFHQLLSGSSIDVITTSTIMKSFLRKYSAMADFTDQELYSLFRFRPDTYYDPPELLKLHEKGVFGKERYEFLACKDW